METYLRRTWAEVDMDRIKHNFKAIREAADNSAGIMCVIKADGYGHGAVFLARTYEKLGASWFAVSNIEEAMQLRENGIALPILILGFTPAEYAGILSDNNISQAVFSEEYAKELSENAVRKNKEVKIHIKLDTGMSRIGFMYQDKERDFASLDTITDICKLPGLRPEGIFTHFAVSDEAEEGAEATRKQLEHFSDAVSKLRERGIGFEIVHCSNSGAIIDYKQAHFDCVRAGIILYGLSPSGKLKGRLDLLPAMKIKSVIAQIKTVQPGTAVSYGGIYVTDKPTVIATVPIGYADGYSRSLSQRAYMSVAGKKAPVIGRVCMDQVMIDVTGIENIHTGDEVTVIGDGMDGAMSFDDIAELTGTINYEVVCLVGKRVPRVYLKNGRNVGIMDIIRNTN